MSLGKRGRPPKGERVMEKQALQLYTPPFHHECGYIFDAKNEMVVDHSGGTPIDLCDERIGDDSICRVRGWGRLGKLPNGDTLQDAVGELIAKALTEYWETNL